jgi:hypothetical protein
VRLPRVALVGLLFLWPSLAGAEPITLSYDVTVTTLNEIAIDPITFVLEVELFSGRNVGDYGYYGGLSHSAIPLGTPNPPGGGGDAWYGDGRAVINGDFWGADGPAWLYLTRTIDLGTTNPPFEQWLSVMTKGPVDFSYELPAEGQKWQGTAVAVPEPSTMLSLMTGLALFMLQRRSTSRRRARVS